MSQPTPHVSVVIPTYNESGNILTLLPRIHDVLTGIPHEVIVTDDDSPDGTWRLAEAYGRDHPWVRVLRRTAHPGLSPAVLDAFRVARGDILAVMDADLSHDERILPKLVEAVDAGADLSVGSRRIAGGGAEDWPWYRRFTSNVATRMAKFLLGVPLSDPMSGYFAIRRALFEESKDRLLPSGYKILLELYCEGRPRRIAEVPFVFRNRIQGYSKLTPWVIGQYVAMVVRLRRRGRVR